jgi:hypothetical protein
MQLDSYAATLAITRRKPTHRKACYATNPLSRFPTLSTPQNLHYGKAPLVNPMTTALH